MIVRFKQALGATSRAHVGPPPKFPPEEVNTRLLDIQFKWVRTGREAHGVMERILVAGSHVSRATLHNM